MRSRRPRRDRRRPRALLASAALLPAVLAGGCGEPEPGLLLIRGGTVIDGTGAPGVQADVRVAAGRVAEVGPDLRRRRGEVVVDASGRVLAPGFIDTHSHHDRGLLDDPAAAALVSQGVTTIVVGLDGSSPLPVDGFLGDVARSPPAVNVAAYVGHGTIRRSVMGDDYRRAATAAEIDMMRAFVREEVLSGALGLSTGLEYDPGIYATTEEIVALAREAGEVGGRYATHLRSEDRGLFEAVAEAIRIGREADVPVHISHVKLAMASLWGRAGELVARLDSARAAGVDVTADAYPYVSWQSTMTVLFPDRAYTREAARFALDELAPPDGMVLARYTPDPSYEGRSLADVAAERGEDPVTTYLTLIAATHGPDAPPGAREAVVARSMSEEDVGELLRWPHTNVASDGALAGAHPRGWGTFPKVLGRWVRERRALTLEEAVHKMTGLAAEHVGLVGRGVVRVGAPADLVLFDPETVADHATLADPHAAASGIVGVWVAGERVWNDGVATGVRAGRVLRRGGGPGGS